MPMTDGDRFEDTMARVTERYAQGRYADALNVVLAADAPPGWVAIRTLLEANLRCMLGDHDLTIGVLEAGIERGEWWRPEMLEGDHDFDPLREDPRFDAIVAETRRRADAAEANGVPGLEMLEPAEPDGSLLVALHGGSGNAAEFAPRWRAAAQRGTLVAVPQSSRPACAGGERFSWPPPEEAAGQLRAQLVEVRAAHRVDRVVYAGFSQGARVGLWCALHAEPEAPAGVIAVVGTPDVEDVADRLPAAAERGLRVWFLTGDVDFAAPAVRAAHAAFGAAGIECRLTETAGIGHAFPPAFDEMLPGMLEFAFGTG
jgi:predicted esterase